MSRNRLDGSKNYHWNFVTPFSHIQVNQTFTLLLETSTFEEKLLKGMASLKKVKSLQLWNLHKNNNSSVYKTFTYI